MAHTSLAHGAAMQRWVNEGRDALARAGSSCQGDNPELFLSVLCTVLHVQARADYPCWSFTCAVKVLQCGAWLKIFWNVWLSARAGTLHNDKSFKCFTAERHVRQKTLLVKDFQIIQLFRLGPLCSQHLSFSCEVARVNFPRANSLTLLCKLDSIPLR